MKPQTQGWWVDEQGEGFPLVLLHGLGANAFSWRHNVAFLAQHFRVLALDLPGHGRTPASLVSQHRLETMAQALGNWLKGQGLARFAVAGNSLGGSLALLLARDHPEEVAALILLAPAVALFRLPWIFYALRLPGLGIIIAALLGPWILPWALRLTYHRRELITPAVIQGYAPTFRPLANRLALRRLAQQAEPWPPAKVEALLRTIHQPTCILWGVEDRILPVRQAYWLATHLPQAELHFLPAVGHAPQEEAPDAVNKIIIAFLKYSLKN